MREHHLHLFEPPDLSVVQWSRELHSEALADRQQIDEGLRVSPLTLSLRRE